MIAPQEPPSASTASSRMSGPGSTPAQPRVCASATLASSRGRSPRPSAPGDVSIDPEGVDVGSPPFGAPSDTRPPSGSLAGRYGSSRTKASGDSNSGPADQEWDQASS